MSQKAQNALNEKKLKLFAPPHENAEIKYDKPVIPELIPKIVDNQPHLEVRTGVAGDKNYGKIEAAMDSHTFWSFLAGLKRIIDNRLDQFTVECKGHPWTGQGRSKEALVMTRVTAGRDKDGWIFLMVTDFDKSRPRIKFKFQPTMYHPWLNKEGAPFTESELSNLYCEAWIAIFSSLMPQVLASEFISWQEKKERDDAKRGGGQNNNRGGGGGYQSNQQRGGGQQTPQPADDVDDDIPF